MPIWQSFLSLRTLMTNPYNRAARRSKWILILPSHIINWPRRTLQKHMYAEAVAELQKAVQLSAGSPTCIANLARAYVLSGNRSEAEKLLSDLKKRSNPGYSNASEIAMIYASLGDTDQAMSWLEKGFEERFNPGVLLRPGFDPLRSDSRFQNLVHRIGLPG